MLVFSHGLIGHYNTYSDSLGEPASQDIVCLAPEHRDGSGSITLLRIGYVEGARRARLPHRFINGFLLEQEQTNLQAGMNNFGFGYLRISYVKSFSVAQTGTPATQSCVRDGR